MKINVKETPTPTTIGMSCFSNTGSQLCDFLFSLITNCGKSKRIKTRILFKKTQTNKQTNKYLKYNIICYLALLSVVLMGAFEVFLFNISTNSVLFACEALVPVTCWAGWFEYWWTSTKVVLSIRFILYNVNPEGWVSSRAWATDLGEEWSCCELVCWLFSPWREACLKVWLCVNKDSGCMWLGCNIGWSGCWVIRLVGVTCVCLFCVCASRGLE